MKIGELAERSGIAVSTLRYYEKRGLLHSIARTEAGYRDYSDSALKHLDVIVAAKNLGFTLEKIRHILLIIDEPDSCDGFILLAKERLHNVREEIARLTHIEERLTECVEHDVCAEQAVDGMCHLLSTHASVEIAADKPQEKPTRKSVRRDSLTSVLVIDHAESHLRLLTTIIERNLDWNVMAVQSLAEALTIVSDMPPDIVLIDSALPGTTGAESLAALETVMTDSETPIMMIGHNEESFRIDEFIEAGATAYIARPIDVQEFLSTLRDIVRKT